MTLTLIVSAFLALVLVIGAFSPALSIVEDDKPTIAVLTLSAQRWPRANSPENSAPAVDHFES